MHNELTALLQDVIDTMTDGGEFELLELADDDSGLPLVYGKLCRALELAGHFTVPDALHRPSRQDHPDHRLQ